LRAKQALTLELRRRGLMVQISVENLGETVIFRCQGRITSGDENAILQTAALSHAEVSTLVLDLVQVPVIDAGGLGVLLALRTWTDANGIQLELMNVPSAVQQVLEATQLDRVFEIRSEIGMVCLPQSRADMQPSSAPSLDEGKPAEQDRSVAVRGQ